MVDLPTIQLGTDEVWCARLDLTDTLTAAEVERAMVRMGSDIRDQHPDVHEVFLEPVPSSDHTVLERVRVRYGDDLAQQIVDQTTGARRGSTALIND